jgi:hypothetical protein
VGQKVLVRPSADSFAEKSQKLFSYFSLPFPNFHSLFLPDATGSHLV